jgi:hypothetical protein
MNRVVSVVTKEVKTPGGLCFVAVASTEDGKGGHVSGPMSSSVAEAVGHLVCDNPNLFGVEIKIH